MTNDSVFLPYESTGTFSLDANCNFSELHVSSLDRALDKAAVPPGLEGSKNHSANGARKQDLPGCQHETSANGNDKATTQYVCAAALGH